MKFNESYFNSLYAADETIDGDFNAKDHANYLKHLFHLMGYHPSSIYDFGFGKGTLLREVSKKLECTQIGGCDVSVYALKKLKQKKWAQDWKLEISEIYYIKKPKRPYHIGLCNSVLQYVDDKNLEKVLSTLANSCKFVYLHVPSKEDYKILKADLNFVDKYAHQRGNDYYVKLISKYFNFVSWGLVESKKFANHRTSIFMDSLYRF